MERQTKNGGLPSMSMGRLLKNLGNSSLKLACRLALIAGLTLAGLASAAPVPPSHVTINNETNPLGIDSEVPLRFGWHMESQRRSELQTAYRVVVAATAEAANAGTGDVWDSGKVMSSEQTGIPYGGTLAPRTGYFMRVKLWDRDNRETPWSDVATFETAMLSPQDWKAKWVGTGVNLNCVRREFQIDAQKTIGRARAYVAGVGSYVMRLNGKKVGDEYMAPMKTYYDNDENKSRILYRTFDVAGWLKPGTNAVGIMLQSGFMYPGPFNMAICEIHIDYTDGTKDVVLSDSSWKGYKGGPYVLADYVDGETYDARMELTGWDSPGFDDLDWTPAPLPQPIANGVLNAVGADEVLCDRDGSTWTNYTLAARFQIKSGFVSLVFRAQDLQNLYMWQLDEGGALRPHKLVNGTYTLLKQVDIGAVTAGWHDLQIECTGSTIKTTLDGVLRDTTVDGTFTHGKVGIRQVGTDAAEIDTMTVTAADGTVLFNDTFDTDTNWSRIYKAQPLVAQTSRTIAHQTLTPKLLSKTGTRSRYDLGANISGFVELEATGATGDLVTITTAEMITTNGELDRSSYIIGNLYYARSIDYYTLKGGGPESYKPEFTSHGFRYFEISAPATTIVTNVVVKAIGNSMPLQAHFDCSTKVLNEIYQGYVWGQRDNSISFPMGCNNRAERQAWVLDAQVTEQSAMLYFGAQGFYEKWLNDFLDGEMANGFMGVVVPAGRSGTDPIWSAAAATLPWDHFAAYGDTAVAAHYYPRATRYVACLDAWAPTGIMTSTPEHKSEWTDWMAVDNNNKSAEELFLTLFYYRSVDFVKNLSQALGKTADTMAYEATLAKIKNAYNARFLHTDRYDDGQQAADALSLYFGLVPEASRAAVAMHLAADVKAHGTHLTVGALGAYALLGALHDNGQEDVAYELATQTTFPSWGYMVENGPGTYWEKWTNDLSLNHPFMAGGVSRYVINAVGGIDRLEPAYKKIQLKPYTGGGQTRASTRLESVRGDIVMNWQKTGGVLTYHTGIPANTTAEIFFPIPAGRTNLTTDGNHWNTEDLTYLRTQGGYAVFKMGSGTYDFSLDSNGYLTVPIVVTTDNQYSDGSFTPTWPVATDSLIGGMSPSSSSSASGFQLYGGGGISKLTDGAIGPIGSGGGPLACAGNDPNAGQYVVYTLPGGSGYDITNITTYSGWNDIGRDAQAYTVYYATVADPATFIFLGSVYYNPDLSAAYYPSPSANRVMLADSAGAPVARNVAKLKFDFSSPASENSAVFYAEITVQGTPSKDSITVANPSFETGYNSTNWPHNGAIPGWSGGSGINDASGPFWDNGATVDGTYVGFLQGDGLLGQGTSGYEVGETYWIQGFANVRTASTGTANVSVYNAASTAGSAPLAVLSFTPVGGAVGSGNPFTFFNVPFTAAATNGDLNFGKTGADLVLDGFSIIRRSTNDIVIMNPSFEASGTGQTSTGVVAAVAGWTLSGPGGPPIINQAGGAYLDSGEVVPDGQNVLVIQGVCAYSQTLQGLTVGKSYRLTVYVNGRAGTQPAALITIDGKIAYNAPVPQLGSSAYQFISYDFVASAADVTLSLGGTGGNAYFVDDVRVYAPTPIAPTIDAQIQPTNATRYVGGTITFTASVSGYPTPLLQWKRNGSSILHATNATLALSNLQLADAGSYVLTATNSAGGTTSSNATLTVAQSAYMSAVLADNPLVYYPLDETNGTTATDATGNGRNGTYVNVTLGSASLTNGLGTAAGFNGSSSTVAVPAMGGSHAQASYEVWVKPAASSGGPAIYDEDGWTVGTSQVMLNGDGGVFQYSLGGEGDSAGPAFTLNQWVYLVVTYDSTLASGHLKFYTNGVLAQTVSADANNVAANLGAAHLGAFNNGGLSRFFTGSMDDFALYGTVLPASRIWAHYLAGLGIPIVITQQPASFAATAGQEATFTVGATASSGTLTYQWQTNGTAILNATNASYTTAPVTLADSGRIFRCVVSAGASSLTSSNATLTVTQSAYTNAVLADNPLVFYPLDETSGTTAIDYSGNGRNGTYVSVALGSASLTNGLGTAVSFNGSSSTVAVPAMGGSHAQASYEVWVKPAAYGGLPAIYDEDGWVTGTSQLMLGDGGVFQYSLNGGGDLFGPAFTLNQWVHLVVTYDSTLASGHLKFYTNGVLAKTVSADANNVAANLAAAHLGAFANGGLSRFFTGSMDDFALYGTVLPVSRIATHYAVGAGIPIIITQQPASANVQAGHSATFTMAAVSTVGVVSYQWQTNGTAILWATNASYTTPPVTLAESGTIFRCVVSAGTNSLTSSSATLTVTGSTEPAWDEYSDTWVATDGLGRSLPTYEAVGPVKNNRLVGCFYLQWLVGGAVYDNTQLLTANPTNPAFGPRWAFHFWGKPLFGYYRNDDRYVLRKHAQMLSDIGVDMVYIDISNTYTYDTARQALCQELEQRLSAGQRVPKLAFLPHTDMSNTVQYTYNNFYAPQLYTNLWFNWQGKPLMLAQASDVSPECQSFFTFRYMWNLAGQDNWPLTYAYPQDYGWDANANVPEELTVRVAESPVANCGRSYVNGVEPAPAQQTPALGLQFSQQWSQALSVGAEITCVTGWNEWIAQRFVAGATSDGLPPFLGQQTTNGQTFFVDQYNEEFSRDTEPMSPDEPGSFGDNYYYQFASFIRQLKGARPIPSVRSWPITIAGGTFDDWALVTPEFRDTIGDPAARNNPGYDSATTYVNQTGRNDLMAAKASADGTNVYFYVRTAAALTAPSTNWMLLFIDADGNHTNGWLGYDFVVNRSGLAVTNGLGTTTVERNLGGYAWGSPVTVPLHYAGNELELAIPRSVLGTNTTLDFKWADNILQTGNWSDFTLNGDAAPNDRFNYRAILTTNIYSLVAPGGTWKFNDTGANLGTAWSSPGYNDSGWASGPAILGYGAGYEATTVGYGANANSKYITTYFRQTFTVADASGFTNLTVRLLRVAGAVVYLNGTEIARQNMPAGTISATTLASATVSGTNRWVYFNSQTNAAALLSGTNVLAVEVHLRAVNNTNVSFDLELLGNGGVPFAAALTAPTDGATLATNQLTLTAAVSRTATVQFYTNGQSVATVATAPYTVTLTGLAPGTYDCTAVATDPSGHTASAAASVTLTQPQTVLPATTGNAYADAVLADHPLVYYRLNETNGTTAVDASPNAHNGTYANVTLGNPTYNANILGTCAGFNNTNSSVAVPCVQGEDGGNQVSFEMWVKPNSFSGNLNSLYMNDDWWQGWVELQFNLIGGVGTFQFTLNGNSPNDVFVAGFATNQWYHLVATYDSTAPTNQLKVYTNGVFMASRSYTAVVPVFLGVAHLGEFFNVNHSPSRLSDGSSRFFDGLMDDFAIFGTVLSASQVQAHFNAGSTVGPASMWLNFNNTLSDQGTDANPHDGTVVGNASFDPAVANSSCGTASEYFPGGGRVQVANPANLNLNTGVPFTLSAWIKPAFSSGKHIIIAKSPTNFSSATHTPALYVTASGNLAYSVAYVGDTTTTATIPNGQWTHVAVTYDGSSYQLYLNGQPAATTVRGSGGANEPVSGSTWQFTLGQSLNTAVSAGDWVGNLDEAAYWPFVLPSAAVNQLFSLGVPPTVIITQSPADVTVQSGMTATFTVGASANSGTLAYQWQRNGVTLAGATNFSYTTPVLGTNNSGDQYRCAVSAGSTLATSATATLTVLAAAPSLLPVISGNNLTVSWAGTGYKLQQTSSLSSGAWTDVPGGNVSPVSVTIGAGNQFFRLISQ